MISQWTNMSISYFKVCDEPVYIRPNDTFLLLRLDYMGFYFPAIHFYKFDFLKGILTTKLSTESLSEWSIDKTKKVSMIDLTDDFLTMAETDRLDFSKMPVLMYHLLVGDQHTVPQYKREYQPLVPFFKFLGLEQDFLDLL